MTTPHGPLKGVRVLDLTRLYPGPLCSWLLAGLGAEIIKIEHPQKPDYVRTAPPLNKGRSALFEALNRGKKSLAADITQKEGRALFLELVKEADLVLEGFRPGVMAKNGLDYETARTVNPAIIYVSITGYGQDGPYAQHAGHDLNYIGYAGILGATGTPNSGPVTPGIQIADTAAGAYMGAIGALSALHARTVDGLGQHVDVAMLDGCLPLAMLQLVHSWDGGLPTDRGKAMLSGGLPNYNTYRCADGAYVALGALEPKFWLGFCTMVGRPNWFDTLANPKKHDQLAQEVAELFLARDRDHWLAMAKEYDICLTPILDLKEIADDPHLQHRKMVQTTPQRLGMPLKFSRTSGSAPSGNAPTPGQDSDTILSEAGYPPDEIERLRQLGVLL